MQPPNQDDDGGGGRVGPTIDPYVVRRDVPGVFAREWHSGFGRFVRDLPPMLLRLIQYLPPMTLPVRPVPLSRADYDDDELNLGPSADNINRLRLQAELGPTRALVPRHKNRHARRQGRLKTGPRKNRRSRGRR